MVDASAGGALMNKTPEEAWELIESMTDNNQHFKVRATSAAKGVFEVTPSESTILVKSLVDIAAMLKEIKEGQTTNSKPLTQHANTSQQQQQQNQFRQPYTYNQPQNPQNRRYQPPNTRQTYPPPNVPPSNYEETLRAYQQESREIKENQKRLDSQLSYITELLHKFTNQPTINPQPQPSTSSPLPSQPLPNPKGGINMVHNENDEEEDEEDDDEWLYGLLAELEDSNDDSDDEEVEEELEREVDDEVVEEETKGETFFIATIFRGNEVKETEMPVKCEDPGPCLVTSKIRGWISPNACVIRELAVMSCLTHSMKLWILVR
ncbi:hypothetical protein PIB30_066262 [Stylosanthes scabra]|uniref:Uncharacterized protein n=1 Tax=Stylosanthes scabra TaxID=79078 RepID=A0ABU6SME1_9FABA|nr:hypothetical protein [Stylosanthes scabra]